MITLSAMSVFKGLKGSIHKHRNVTHSSSNMKITTGFWIAFTVAFLTQCLLLYRWSTGICTSATCGAVGGGWTPAGGSGTDISGDAMSSVVPGRSHHALLAAVVDKAVGNFRPPSDEELLALEESIIADKQALIQRVRDHMQQPTYQPAVDASRYPAPYELDAISLLQHTVSDDTPPPAYVWQQQITAPQPGGWASLSQWADSSISENDLNILQFVHPQAVARFRWNRYTQHANGSWVLNDTAATTVPTVEWIDAPCSLYAQLAAHSRNVSHLSPDGEETFMSTRLLDSQHMLQWLLEQMHAAGMGIPDYMDIAINIQDFPELHKWRYLWPQQRQRQHRHSDDAAIDMFDDDLDDKSLHNDGTAAYVYNHEHEARCASAQSSPHGGRVAATGIWMNLTDEYGVHTSDFYGEGQCMTVVPAPMFSPCTSADHLDVPWFWELQHVVRPIESLLPYLLGRRYDGWSYYFSWAHNSTLDLPTALQYNLLHYEPVAPCEAVHASCRPGQDIETDPDRQPKAVWRGSNTGGEPTLDEWLSMTRSKLVLHSMWHPDIIDARFTQVWNYSAAQYDAMLKQLGDYVGSPLPDWGDFLLRYQLLIDVDGNAWSSRYYSLLSTGAAVLKQQSVWKEWWYDIVKPYEHFIPLRKDLSGLVDVARTMLAHPFYAQRVGENSVRQMATYLNRDSIVQYAAATLNAYSKKLVKPWDLHYEPSKHRYPSCVEASTHWCRCNLAATATE